MDVSNDSIVSGFGQFAVLFGIPLDFSLTIRVFYMFYMLMFLCYLFIRIVRKLKCVIYFILISLDSIQSKLVFECMVLIQNGFFSFNFKTI